MLGLFAVHAAGRRRIFVPLFDLARGGDRAETAGLAAQGDPAVARPRCAPDQFTSSSRISEQRVGNHLLLSGESSFSGYKLLQVTRERLCSSHDFVRVQPGERIIPEDALDRYKEMKRAVERDPRWQGRLLPECMLAALHRFHATNSVQDAANADQGTRGARGRPT